MKFIWFLIKDWFYFIFHPQTKKIELPLKNKIISVAFYFILLFILTNAISYLFSFIFFRLSTTHVIPYPILLKPRNDVTILSAVVFAPIYEELVFRLSLRFKPIFLAITLSLAIFDIIINITLVHPFHNIWYGLVNSAIIIVMTIIFYFLFRAFYERLSKFWDNYKGLIFYFFAITFGYLHLMNYQIEHYSIILLSPIFLFPYVFGGINFGFLRLRYGIFISIAFHSLQNLIPFIIIKLI